VNIAAPIRRNERDLLEVRRYTARGTSRMYRITNTMEGTKSDGRGVPPTGAGMFTITRLCIGPASRKVAQLYICRAFLRPSRFEDTLGALLK